MTAVMIEPTESASASKTVRHLPLPALDDDLLHITAGGGAVWGDSRRFPRFATSAEAQLAAEGTYAAAGHASSTQTVLLRDLSRGGLRFLHGGQLFPGERCGIKMPNGAAMRLEVIWCRRMGAGVYMSGCRFFSVAARAEDDAEGAGESDATAAGD